MKISELPSAAVANTDVFVKETSGGVTQKVSAANMLCYSAGDIVPFSGFRTMGRAVFAGDSIYCFITLDKHIVASSFSITIGSISAFNAGATAATFNTPINITFSGNNGAISGNQIYFTIPVSTTLTGAEIYLLEMTSTTITFA